MKNKIFNIYVWDKCTRSIFNFDLTKKGLTIEVFGYQLTIRWIK